MSAGLLQEYVSLLVEKIRTKKGGTSSLGGSDKDGKKRVSTSFDLKHFKTLPSNIIMKKYADDLLNKLGEGSARAAYLLSSKYALKIAVNRKGIAQNEAELDVFTNPKSRTIVAKVYDAADDNTWLICDLVKPLTSEQEFLQLTGIKWYHFEELVRVHVKGNDTNTSKLTPWVQAVVATAQQNNLMNGDLRELGHWGKTPEGRCVLLDYGFTGSVFKSHYSDKPKLTGKTAKSSEKTNVPGKTGTDRTRKTIAQPGAAEDPSYEDRKGHVEGGFPDD